MSKQNIPILVASVIVGWVHGVCLPQHESLHGYAFDCAGILIGFSGESNIHCMNGVNEPCGQYLWDRDKEVLLGDSALTGPFRASSVELRDGLLISFQSDLDLSCNVVSLDWPRYSFTNFLGIKCPIQNVVPGVSYQDNHFSLGLSGDAALRSSLELVVGSRHVIRDSYGIFQRSQHNDSLKVYFGPQQGRPLIVIEGRLTEKGKLYMDGYMPPGPCLHDGKSSMESTKSLPQGKSQQQHLQVDEALSNSSSSPPGFDVMLNTFAVLVISMYVIM
jgi:hypothetical protein